jgi:subtilisin family serine protease
MDGNNHGTHVAGTIGGVGNNGVGITGVNWVASMMGLKFLGSSGSGWTSAGVLAI